MRVTTANAYESALSNLQSRQQSLSQAQERLTSGKRVEKASDDPVAAARAERALAAMVRSESNQRALDASRNVTTQTESALGDAGSLMQQIREQVLNAGNGSYSDSDRQTLANAIQGMRDQLLGIANRGDGTGNYLFGGQGTQSPPFIDTPSGVTYQGTAGQTVLPSDGQLPTSQDGSKIWLQAPAGAGGGAPLSVFTVLDKIVAELKTPGLSGTQIAQNVKTGLDQVDAVSSNLLAARSAAGATLNQLDTTESRISATKLAAQTDQTNAVDLDMVQAISDFQNQQTGYDAALKSYSTVQKLSLFQYISA